MRHATNATRFLASHSAVIRGKLLCDFRNEHAPENHTRRDTLFAPAKVRAKRCKPNRTAECASIARCFAAKQKRMKTIERLLREGATASIELNRVVWCNYVYALSLTDGDNYRIFRTLRTGFSACANRVDVARAFILFTNLMRACVSLNR